MMKVVVGLVERVKLKGIGRSVTTLAKFDTGAKWCSIDKKLANKIGAKIIKEKNIRSALGKQKRALVELEMELFGKRYRVKATTADRSKLRYLFLVGRNVIFRNFIVDVEKTNKSPNENDLRDDLRKDLRKVENLKKLLGYR